MMVLANWQRLLTATDFSPLGNAAVEYANGLAVDLGAELHVLHIARDVSEVALKHGPTGVMDSTADETDGQAWLREVLGQSKGTRRIDSIQVGHNVAEKILQYAHTHGVQLIVMATHGRSGLAHWWSGSVTEEVIRSAQCPVLVIRSLANKQRINESVQADPVGNKGPWRFGSLEQQ
jgi:nucleotide-binding universal stress UspA family protein